MVFKISHLENEWGDKWSRPVQLSGKPLYHRRFPRDSPCWSAFSATGPLFNFYVRNVLHFEIMSRCSREINQILRRSNLFYVDWIWINLLSSMKRSMNFDEWVLTWKEEKRERDASICRKGIPEATILLIAKLRLVSPHLQHPYISIEL